MFPEWNMKVFNLNEQAEVLPFAFRQMLTALLESSHTISQYTQPTVFRMLEHVQAVEIFLMRIKLLHWEYLWIILIEDLVFWPG